MVQRGWRIHAESDPDLGLLYVENKLQICPEDKKLMALELVQPVLGFLDF
jgi:hypothetical protein